MIFDFRIEIFDFRSTLNVVDLIGYKLQAACSLRPVACSLF
jgi:hypothetical protein